PLPIIVMHPTAHHLTLPSFPTRRSSDLAKVDPHDLTAQREPAHGKGAQHARHGSGLHAAAVQPTPRPVAGQVEVAELAGVVGREDRKSTRLNSSHVKISYAVFCLKKKNK